jgi:hypothetical protein
MLVQKPFQDIITFTRASSATRFNAAGVLETVGNNVPRIDYDPVTLACRGLLIEEQRTNLISRSVEIGLLYNPGGAVMTPNFGVAPDGTLTSSRLVTSSQVFNFNVPAGSAADISGNNYCQSIYFKPKSWTGSVSIYSGDGSSIGGTGFSLVVASAGSAPVITGAGNGNGVGSVSPAGNGWWRLNFPYAATANNTQPTLTFGTGFGAGADVEFWGRQREIGSFPTSYIATTGAQATRAADLASINTLSPWYSAIGGVVFCEFRPMSAEYGVRRVFSLTDGTLNNHMDYYIHTTGAPISLVISNGVQQLSDIYESSVGFGAVNRGAFAYKHQDFGQALNGAAAKQFSGTATVPQLISTLRIGSNVTAANSAFLSGHIRKLRYFPKRLTNAELQALTA